MVEEVGAPGLLEMQEVLGRLVASAVLRSMSRLRGSTAACHSSCRVQGIGVAAAGLLDGGRPADRLAVVVVAVVAAGM